MGGSLSLGADFCAGGDESEVENARKVIQVLNMTLYATTLDAADRLSLEEQEELAATLRRRIAEKRRSRPMGSCVSSRQMLSTDGSRTFFAGAVGG